MKKSFNFSFNGTLLEILLFLFCVIGIIFEIKGGAKTIDLNIWGFLAAMILLLLGSIAEYFTESIEEKEK